MATAVLSRVDLRPPPLPRSLLLASADPSQAKALREELSGHRWQVREAASAAGAMLELDGGPPEILLLGKWLPDIEVNEFANLVLTEFPSVEVVRTDGHAYAKEARSPRRHELMLSLRAFAEGGVDGEQRRFPKQATGRTAHVVELRPLGEPKESPRAAAAERLPGIIGDSAAMRELNAMIRLVAPRDTTVLIEGPTGSGKELVAHALHVLSRRAAQGMAVLNCAAIPETLLEAELFGHTRGAFTGATQSRMGRIEAADGGTLFLDEIGEMPLGLQAKMLRFLECGEIQRVGDNAMTHVNVRVIAATHQPLEQRAAEGTFRLDLYHRLAVFPVEIPSLMERIEDLPLLAEHFLNRFGTAHLSEGALKELTAHGWPGNVRELMHVIERATILCGGTGLIEQGHIRVRRRPR